jgi:IclR family acetate operon transcriptional repressor
MDARTKNTPQANEPRSLLRILGIFEVIAKSKKGMTLAELSAALSAPKSSLLLLLRPLVAHNYLMHNAGQYELGRSIFQLSSEILSGREFNKVIRPYIEELAERSNESVYLAVLDKETRLATYVEGIESRQAVRYAVPAGTVRPLYASAAGKLLLAFQKSDWQERYIKATRFKPLTSKPAVEKADLQRELAEIRKSGVAISIGDAVAGAAGIAAPILMDDGTATHALLIAAPVDRFERALPGLRKMLLEVAANASKTLSNMHNV